MVVYRIRALIYRHILISWRAFPRIIDLLYWPLVNIILWGCTTIDTHQSVGQNKLLFSVMAVLVFWQIMFRSNMEISANIFDELLSQNFANILATPLSLVEIVSAVICVGIIKALFAGLYGAFFSWLFYDIWLFDIGYMIIPFFILSIFSGTAIGLLTLAAIIYWGQKTQPLIWVIGWGFTLLSGIFYRVEILPAAIQHVCWLLPMPYLFESIRSYCLTGAVPWLLLGYAFCLSIVYITATVFVFLYVFQESKKLGLARLDRYE